MIRVLLALYLILPLLAVPVVAQQTPVSANNWAKPYFTRLDVTFSDSAFHARWDIDRCDCGDVYIVSEETLPEEIRKGSQLLLGTEVLLVFGYESYDGPLVGLLDSPMLMTQLLFVLLQHSAPSGPDTVGTTLQPEVEELKTPLLLDSGLAYGAFPAPWKLEGTITPLNTGQFRFELEFTFGLLDTGVQVMRLSGLLDYNHRAFPIDDALVLDGWSAAWLDLETENHDGITPGLTLGEFKKEMGSE